MVRTTLSAMLAPARIRAPEPRVLPVNRPLGPETTQCDEGEADADAARAFSAPRFVDASALPLFQCVPTKVSTDIAVIAATAIRACRTRRGGVEAGESGGAGS